MSIIYFYIHVHILISTVQGLRSSPSSESIMNDNASEYPLGEKGILMKKKIDR
jgi:hypothetical protein